jgi:hypothetical protein
MKLLCFPHYTAGGLICDILEGTFSPIAPNGGIASIAHSLGKVGDSNSIFTDFDPAEINNRLIKYQHDNIVLGTHCWPINVDLSIPEEVITITTETSKSKIYRWLRAWHLYFSKTDAVKNLSGMELIDKQRELAKNYLAPFSVVPNATNLEFADIVQTTTEFYKVIKDLPSEEHITRWKNINYFLYDTSLWNNELVDRYYEAEFEVTHGRLYQYE